MRGLLVIVLGLASAAPARAHAPAAADHAHAGWSWNFDPVVLVPTLALLLLYALGIARLWSRAGVGRGVPVWRAAACLAGLAALGGALLTPLDAAAEVSFALHMTQHMLLVVVAAPLLALANVGVVTLSWLPGGLRAPLGRAIASHPVRRLRGWLLALPVTTALHGVVLWLWHAPALYEAALADPLVHYLEHVTMFGSGVMFWWSATTAWWRAPLGHGAGVGALFLTMLHSGMLGILLTLAPVPLYASYAAAAPLGTLGPLEDQQVAGIVMLTGGFAYLAAGLVLLASWLNPAPGAPERRVS